MRRLLYSALFGFGLVACAPAEGTLEIPDRQLEAEEDCCPDDPEGEDPEGEDPEEGEDPC